MIRRGRHRYRVTKANAAGWASSGQLARLAAPVPGAQQVVASDERCDPTDCIVASTMIQAPDGIHADSVSAFLTSIVISTFLVRLGQRAGRLL